MGRRIASQRWVLCTAPSYLARRGRPQHPVEVQDHDCLVYIRDGRHLPWLLTDAAGATIDVKFKLRHMISHGEALRDSSLAGNGPSLSDNLDDRRRPARRDARSDYDARSPRRCANSCPVAANTRSCTKGSRRGGCPGCSFSTNSCMGSGPSDLSRLPSACGWERQAVLYDCLLGFEE